MQRERAELLAGLRGNASVLALFDEIKERKDLANKKLQNPANTHDKDSFYKGGIAMADDILNITAEAFRVLNTPKQEGEEE